MLQISPRGNMCSSDIVSYVALPKSITQSASKTMDNFQNEAYMKYN